MAEKQLPARQQATLDVVAKFHHEKGYAPSLSEVASELGRAKPTAQSAVGKLIAKGYLERVDGRIMLAGATGRPRLGAIRAASRQNSKTTTGSLPSWPCRVAMREDSIVVTIAERVVAVVKVGERGHVTVETPVGQVPAPVGAR